MANYKRDTEIVSTNEDGDDNKALVNKTANATANATATSTGTVDALTYKTYRWQKPWIICKDALLGNLFMHGGITALTAMLNLVIIGNITLTPDIVVGGILISLIIYPYILIMFKIWRTSFNVPYLVFQIVTMIPCMILGNMGFRAPKEWKSIMLFEKRDPISNTLLDINQYSPGTTLKLYIYALISSIIGICAGVMPVFYLFGSSNLSLFDIKRNLTTTQTYIIITAFTFMYYITLFGINQRHIEYDHRMFVNVPFQVLRRSRLYIDGFFSTEIQDREHQLYRERCQTMAMTTAIYTIVYYFLVGIPGDIITQIVVVTASNDNGPSSLSSLYLTLIAFITTFAVGFIMQLNNAFDYKQINKQFINMEKVKEGKK